MEKSKLEKLITALDEAGFEADTVIEETVRYSDSNERKKTGYTLLKVHPVAED
jgi:hypothetical protein